MNKINLKYYFSIASGLISTAVVAYSLLAPVWGFHMADKLFSTGSIIVMVLSMILSVFTGQKIADKLSPETMLESTYDRTVYEQDDNDDIVKENIETLEKE